MNLLVTIIFIQLKNIISKYLVIYFNIFINKFKSGKYFNSSIAKLLQSHKMKFFKNLKMYNDKTILLNSIYGGLQNNYTNTMDFINEIFISKVLKNSKDNYNSIAKITKNFQTEKKENAKNIFNKLNK